MLDYALLLSTPKWKHVSASQQQPTICLLHPAVYCKWALTFQNPFAMDPQSKEAFKNAFLSFMFWIQITPFPNFKKKHPLYSIYALNSYLEQLLASSKHTDETG